MGKYIVLIGVGVILVGLILHFFPNAFKWFGNLPGDFKSTDGNVKFYFPLMSMIVISVIANVLLRLWRNFGG